MSDNWFTTFLILTMEHNHSAGMRGKWFTIFLIVLICIAFSMGVWMISFVSYKKSKENKDEKVVVKMLNQLEEAERLKKEE